MKNIHILPTDNPSRLRYNTYDEIYYFSEIPKNSIDIKCTQYMYITSYEEIKDNDWYINTKGKLLQFTGRNILNDKFEGNKVILTTDIKLIKDGVQDITKVPNYEFLYWFVKNPGTMFVEVEKKYSKWNIVTGSVFSHYEIIIPQDKPIQEIVEDLKIGLDNAIQKSNPLFPKYKSLNKQKIEEEAKERAKNTMALKGALDVKEETLEEAATKEGLFRASQHNYIQAQAAYNAKWFKRGALYGAKWQAERMYSEEDMINFAKFAKNYRNPSDVKKAFEQFKKK